MNTTQDNTPAPIVIEGTTIEAQLVGDKYMYCLNDIAKAGGLTGRKARPSYWDNTISRHFKLNRNFCLVGNTNNSKGYADERAAIAYAMWVSLDFYLMVVDAFILVRNDLKLSKRMNAVLQHQKDKAQHKCNTAKAQAADALREAAQANTRLARYKTSPSLTISQFCDLYTLPRNKFMQSLRDKGFIIKTMGSNRATPKGEYAGFNNIPSKMGVRVTMSRDLIDRWSTPETMDKIRHTLADKY